MKIIEAEQAQYLIKSLQHHPSPYIIYDKDSGVEWLNNSAQYIFNLKDDESISIEPITDVKKNNNKSEIARSFDTDIQIKLRDIEFFLRTRIHEIPFEEKSSFFLIEALANSEAALDALKETISCLENDRISMAFQKQVDIETGDILGVESLLRLLDEEGNIISNDKLIPLVEGEHLFSLVVLASLKKLKEFFNFLNKENLGNFTTYLNVSAYTVMQENFTKIILDFVNENDLKENQLGLEITETAELEDRKKPSEAFESLKKSGVPLALDDFGAGYSSLSYLRDLPISLIKLDKNFATTIDLSDTKELVRFVVNISDNLGLDMIVEGIETEDQKNIFLELGCKRGQGYFFHRPEFLEDFAGNLDE